MINIERLVKDYGPVRALQGVTFDVPSGQVLGFLGPNGAGKTTTMKILTGYLYPTSGRVVVNGMDVTEDSIEVRRSVGYLPETNPLYQDMRVDDYLEFVAQVRGLRGRQKKAAIERVVSICGVGTVYKKGILELSKGFRQRVGLAQAMIHDPDILILDEPTSGLDPNQIIEIRDLIRSVGSNRTVILSTHILQEVEATCDRIIIVATGQIVADGTAQELMAQLPAGSLEIEVIGPAESIEKQLAELFVGGSVVRLPDAKESDSGVRFRVQVSTQMDRHAKEAVFDLITGNGWKLLTLHREAASLEAVFRKFTLGEGNGSPAEAAEAEESAESVAVAATSADTSPEERSAEGSSSAPGASEGGE